MKPAKKWKDMTAAERARERVRIEKEVKKAEREFFNSESQRIVRAMSDGRTHSFEQQIFDTAVWCLSHRGKPLPSHYIRHEVIYRLRDGNAAFFRKLADALESLEKEGLSKSSPPTARLVIAKNFDRWEYEKTKIVVRLAQIKEATGKQISQARYYGIVEQDRLKTT